MCFWKPHNFFQVSIFNAFLRNNFSKIWWFFKNFRKISYFLTKCKVFNQNWTKSRCFNQNFDKIKNFLLKTHFLVIKLWFFKIFGLLQRSKVYFWTFFQTPLRVFQAPLLAQPPLQHLWFLSKVFNGIKIHPSLI